MSGAVASGIGVVGMLIDIIKYARPGRRLDISKGGVAATNVASGVAAAVVRLNERRPKCMRVVAILAIGNSSVDRVSVVNVTIPKAQWLLIRRRLDKSVCKGVGKWIRNVGDARSILLPRLLRVLALHEMRVREAQ